LADRDLADPATVETLRAAWEDAYMATPHGQPVHLRAEG